MSQSAQTQTTTLVRTAAPLTVFTGRPRSTDVPDYEVEVCCSAEELDRASWDCLRDANDLFMDVRLLRAVERSMARDASFRYVLIRDETGGPAAAACLCTYTVDGTVLATDGLSRRLACALKRISPALVRYRILFCGLPFSGGQSHLRFADGADPARVCRALDGLLRRAARDDGAKCIVWKEFQERELPALASLEPLGYRRADSLPMNQVAISHADWDEYLASLHNKKRYEIRKSLKKFDAGGLRMVTTADPAEIERLYTDDVHRMYEAVVARSDTKLELLPAQFFREMVRSLPENCEICFALDGDNHVRGFGLCLYSRREYHPLFLGIDYDRNRDHDLYFNLMYRSLADAMRHRSAVVLLGQNADTCKSIKVGSHQ